VGVGLGLLAQTGLTQEAVRASLAGEAAAAAKHQAATTIGYYNLKLGDLRLRLTSGVDVEANDNVNLAEHGAQSDVILRPQFNSSFDYPLTEHNALNLTLGAGYSAYLRYGSLNRFFVTPGSALAFDVYVGDWVINLHDRFSVSQEAYQNPAAAGSGNIGTFDNSSGVSATWDLNDLIVTGGYDYLLRRSTTSGFSQQDANTHAWYLSGGIRPNSSSVLRVDLGTSLIDRQTQSDGVQYNAGLSYQATVSEYISAHAAAGYTIYSLDNSGIAGGGKDVRGMYGSLGVQHRLNRIVSYSLDAGRDIQIGLFSDILDLYFVRLQSNWKLIRKFSLTTNLSYERGKESGGSGDKITRYGAGISLGRSITKKLSASLSYDFLDRESELPRRGYHQNRVMLHGDYAF